MSKPFLINPLILGLKTMTKIEQNFVIPTQQARRTAATNIALPWDEIRRSRKIPAQKLLADQVGGQQIPSSNPKGINHPDEHLLIGSPKELQLHSALLEPFLITHNGTIFKGFGRMALSYAR